MKNAILVPGRPDKDLHYDPEFPNNSENYWFSWLKRQLIVEDIQADTIEPPTCIHTWQKWAQRKPKWVSLP